MAFDSAAIAKEYGLKPQEVQARRLMLQVARWKADFRLFARQVVRIRSKEGVIVPLVFNDAQEILHSAGEQMLKDEQWIRIMGLKGRREGFSTYVGARGYWRAILWDLQNIYILSHEMKSSDVLFGMVALMQEQNEFAPEVGRDNAKELEFKKRRSSYTVATAGVKAGGRGTAISFMHCSEAAWWTNAEDHFASSVQAVDEVRGKWGVLWRRPENPLPFEMEEEIIEGWVRAPSEVWMETTSAGPSGVFHNRYKSAMRGEGLYRHVFVPWTAEKAYTRDGEFVPGVDPEEEAGLSEAEYQTAYNLTDGQMLWRRGKVQELGSFARFRQEYPTTIEEAFSAAESDDVFIRSSAILLARKRPMADPDAPLIIGVDPAAAGGDRFAIAWRRGDKCLKTKYRHRLDHEAAVAWITSIIDEDEPSRVLIDRGNIGVNILSTIRNLAPKYALVVKGIDFGGTSQAKQANPTRSGPVNRRAEIYGRMRDWLVDGSIPDDDELASDLAGPKIKFRPNNDWLLESKSDMKARGVRSPDLGDALALTFATQEHFPEWANAKMQAGFSAGRTELPSRDYTTSNGVSSGGRNGWMA